MRGFSLAIPGRVLAPEPKSTAAIRHSPRPLPQPPVVSAPHGPKGPTTLPSTTPRPNETQGYRSVLSDRRGERYQELAVDGHVHTTYSGDAVMSPSGVLRLAVRRGLDAIVITDHNSFGIFTHPLSIPPGLLVLFGMEIGAQDVHIGAWNLTRKVLVKRGEPLGAVIERIREQPNTLVVLNHPGWRVGAQVFSARHFDPRSERRFDAVEIWNASFWQNVAPNIQRWESFLASGLYVPLLGSSDSHHGRVGRPRTVFYVLQRDAEGIIDAARHGRGYITDDARLNLTANGAIFGQLLKVGPGEPLLVRVDGQSRHGGTLRLYWRRQLVLERQLDRGAFRVRHQLAVTRDGWLRIEILRVKPVRYGRLRFTHSLVGNPILVDLPPFGDTWRLNR